MKFKDLIDELVEGTVTAINDECAVGIDDFGNIIKRDKHNNKVYLNIYDFLTTNWNAIVDFENLNYWMSDGYSATRMDWQNRYIQLEENDKIVLYKNGIKNENYKFTQDDINSEWMIWG